MSGTEESTSVDGGMGKVDVLLKAVGNAPIIKQSNWSVNATNTIAWLTAFLRKYLKLGNDDSLFIYVNQCFAPSPDHTIATLYECFASDTKLVLHYSITKAWG